MYATASIVVEHSVSECARALNQSPEHWFPRLVSKIGNRSDHQLAAVGFKVSGLPVRKHVQVSLGVPITTGDWIAVPISWRPTFPASLFPGLRRPAQARPSRRGSHPADGERHLRAALRFPRPDPRRDCHARRRRGDAQRAGRVDRRRFEQEPSGRLVCGAGSGRGRSTHRPSAP